MFGLLLLSFLHFFLFHAHLFTLVSFLPPPRPLYFSLPTFPLIKCLLYSFPVAFAVLLPFGL